MRPPTLLFVHGWGFDASLWHGLAAELGDFPAAFVELGYFAPASEPAVAGPVVAVGHSLGSLLLLRRPPADCRALVAINGFDRFAGLADAPGVARRPLDRMLRRLGEAPLAVVAEFRRRCGAPPPPAIADTPLLAAHLRLLRDGDERPSTVAWDRPILSLQAADDPILPPALRADAFAGGRDVRRAGRADGGHALPATQPAWCAGHIRALVAELA